MAAYCFMEESDSNDSESDGLAEAVEKNEDRAKRLKKRKMGTAFNVEQQRGTVKIADRIANPLEQNLEEESASDEDPDVHGSQSRQKQGCTVNRARNHGSKAVARKRPKKPKIDVFQAEHLDHPVKIASADRCPQFGSNQQTNDDPKRIEQAAVNVSVALRDRKAGQTQLSQQLELAAGKQETPNATHTATESCAQPGPQQEDHLDVPQCDRIASDCLKFSDFIAKGLFAGNLFMQPYLAVPILVSRYKDACENSCGKTHRWEEVHATVKHVLHHLELYEQCNRAVLEEFLYVKKKITGLLKASQAKTLNRSHLERSISFHMAPSVYEGFVKRLRLLWTHAQFTTNEEQLQDKDAMALYTNEAWKKFKIRARAFCKVFGVPKEVPWIVGGSENGSRFFHSDDVRVSLIQLLRALRDRNDILRCENITASTKPKQVLKPRTILHIVDLLRQQEARNMAAEPSRGVTGSRPSKAFFPDSVAAPIDSPSVLEDQERNVASFMQLERIVEQLLKKQVERQKAERQREEAERRERQRTPSPTEQRCFEMPSGGKVSDARTKARKSTNVKPFNDELIYCPECNESFLDPCQKHGMFFYDDILSMREQGRQFPHLPLARLVPFPLVIRKSKIPGAGSGIFTKISIPTGVIFGPYQGKVVKGLQSDDSKNNGYSWQLRISCYVEEESYVDASDEASSNWMRYINSDDARMRAQLLFSEKQRHVPIYTSTLVRSPQNLIAFQYKGDIYYRVFEKIYANDELIVYYGPGFAKELRKANP